MALPVKETPVLKGKSAENFAEKYLDHSPVPVSKEELLRMKTNFQKFVIKNAK